MPDQGQPGGPGVGSGGEGGQLGHLGLEAGSPSPRAPSVRRGTDDHLVSDAPTVCAAHVGRGAGLGDVGLHALCAPSLLAEALEAAVHGQGAPGGGVSRGLRDAERARSVPAVSPRAGPAGGSLGAAPPWALVGRSRLEPRGRALRPRPCPPGGRAVSSLGHGPLGGRSQLRGSLCGLWWVGVGGLCALGGLGVGSRTNGAGGPGRG